MIAAPRRAPARRTLLRLALLPCLGCAPDPGGADPGGADPAPDTEAGAPALQYRFLVFADPHVAALAEDHDERLAAAVAWANAHRAELDLQLVLVVGDIGWGAEGLAAAKEILDGLEVPYLPITGDNEVQLGSEALYAETFAPHWAALAADLPDLRPPDGPVENPEIGAPSWLSNLAFTWGDQRFIGVDWASRVIDPLLGETGYLHDFPGGTLPFLLDELSTVGEGREQVILFSHIPMHMSPGGFTVERYAALTGALAPYQGAILADFAGHYHVSGEEEAEGYTLYVTDAIWDDTVDVRLVEVWQDDARTSLITTLLVAAP